MQGFLYTVDPNQGKSGLATFIVHIYGTAINNLRLSLCEARCTEGNPKTQSWKSKLQHEVRLNIRGLSTPNKHFCKSRHEWLSTSRSSWQHQGIQPTHCWKNPCRQKLFFFIKMVDRVLSSLTRFALPQKNSATTPLIKKFIFSCKGSYTPLIQIRVNQGSRHLLYTFMAQQ